MKAYHNDIENQSGKENQAENKKMNKMKENISRK